MATLLEQLKKTIAEVKNHPFIEVDKEEIQPPIDQARIESVETAANVYIPRNIKSFYKLANGFTFVWRIKSGLSEEEMKKIYETEEQPGYDYSKPLGAIKLLPLENVLINAWQPPKESDPGGANALPFGNKAYTYSSFGKMLKPFDAFHPDNDLQCMAFIIRPGATEYEVMMLDDYYADWQNSRVTDFDTYIRLMCETRFTIPSRKRIFGKYRGDKEPKVAFDSVPKETLVPALFK